MKREVLRGLALTGVVVFLLTGCATKRVHEPVVVTPTGQITVSKPPPTPRVERIGSAPATDWVWTPGYWTHHYTRWVWVPGKWQAPPSTGATWIAGHWNETASGWIWTPGHWE